MGTDFMCKHGIQIDFKSQTIWVWFGHHQIVQKHVQFIQTQNHLYTMNALVPEQINEDTCSISVYYQECSSSLPPHKFTSVINYFLPFQAKNTLYSITYQQAMPLQYES